jgi:hypothetical protein
VSPRIKLLLVAAVCVAPLVLGTLAYWSGWSVGKPGNYGELLAPRVVAGPPFEALRGKWVLVSFDAAACDAYCEKKLYFMRQAMERLERLWVLTDGGAPRAELVAEGLRWTRLRLEGFPGEARDHIYVVDPLGNLMMRFPRDPDPSRMVKDLQRLLKLSRFG